MGNIVLYRKLPYDGVRDFAPITQVARSYGLILVVHPGVPAQSVKELVALAKTRPGKAELRLERRRQHHASRRRAFQRERGHADPARALQRQRARAHRRARPPDRDDFRLDGFRAAVHQGRPRAAARLTGEERSPVLPDIPTFKELGYPDVVMTGMYGLWFPAKTPAARVNRVHAEIRKGVATPDMKALISFVRCCPKQLPLWKLSVYWPRIARINA